MKKDNQAMGKRLNLLKWLYWEKVRRNQSYKKDIDNFLEIASQNIKNRNHVLKEAYSKTLEVYDKIINISKRSSEDIKRLVDNGFLSWGTLKNNTCDIKDYINLNVDVEFLVGSLVKYNSFLPELREFRKKWSIGFPLDPNINIPLECLIHPVIANPLRDYEFNAEDNTVAFKVSLDSQKEVIKAHLNKIIDDYFKRFRLKSQIQEKKLYERYFKVWDLANAKKKGLTFKYIAEQMKKEGFYKEKRLYLAEKQARDDYDTAKDIIGYKKTRKNVSKKAIVRLKDVKKEEREKIEHWNKILEDYDLGEKEFVGEKWDNIISAWQDGPTKKRLYDIYKTDREVERRRRNK